MMFANRISSSTSCSIWPPETSPPSSARGVLRHRFESCNTSDPTHPAANEAARNRDEVRLQGFSENRPRAPENDLGARLMKRPPHVGRCQKERQTEIEKAASGSLIPVVNPCVFSEFVAA